MSDDFTEWWTGSYGEFSRRCEWPLTMTQAAKMAWDAKQEEITALRAEVERLRAALERIGFTRPGESGLTLGECIIEARATLGGTDDKG